MPPQNEPPVVGQQHSTSSAPKWLSFLHWVERKFSAFRIQQWQAWLMIAVVIGVTTYSLSALNLKEPASRLVVTEALVGVGAMCLGALVGFLFGLPRTGIIKEESAEGTAGGVPSEDNQKWKPTPSNSLEQVSDWLTKILIGAGLIELTKLPGILHDIGSTVNKGIQDADDASILTQLIALIGVICGFFSGYLWTRISYTYIQFHADLSIRSDIESLKGTVGSVVKAISNVASAQSDTGGSPVNAKIDNQPPNNEVNRVPDPGWLIEVQKKILAFREAPATWNSDPADELFNHPPRKKGNRVLEVVMDSVLDNKVYFTARVRGLEPASPGQVDFLLHPSYGPGRIRSARPKQDSTVVELKFNAEGVFTLVAIADGGDNILGYSLKDVPGVPQWFKDK